MSVLIKRFLGNCILWLIITTSTQAQQDNRLAGATFRSIAQLSLVNGKGAVSGALQTSNGVSFKNWYTGAGAGIDFYRYRSVPLVVDIRREIKVGKSNFFAFAQGGYNLPWVKNEEDIYRTWEGGYYKETVDYTGGVYTDLGLGYAIPYKEKSAFLLSVGYSLKKFRKQIVSINSYTAQAGEPVVNEDVKKFSYDFRRLMIKIGWQF